MTQGDPQVGRSIPRPNARRLLQGKGRFVADKTLPRMLHAVFVRSPHAHARIVGLDLSAARGMPGVVAAYSGADISAHVVPFVGVLTHMTGMLSPPQPPLAVGVTHWQGEAVAMIVRLRCSASVRRCASSAA